jgi:hypothetical protein
MLKQRASIRRYKFSLQLILKCKERVRLYHHARKKENNNFAGFWTLILQQGKEQAHQAGLVMGNFLSTLNARTYNKKAHHHPVALLGTTGSTSKLGNSNSWYFKTIRRRVTHDIYGTHCTASSNG